jgi:hypothetical protein
MRNIILAIIFCSLFQAVKAQNYMPTIKNKTELNYVCKLHGQTRTLTLTATKVTDTLVLELITRDVKSSIITTPEGLKNGNALCYNQGETSPVLALKPNETFFMISRSAYQDLLKDKKFIYNNTTYVLDQSVDKNLFWIDGKVVDTLHVIAQIDETEMWIIKNADYPLICKMTKNPLGINFTLVKVVDK